MRHITLLHRPPTTFEQEERHRTAQAVVQALVALANARGRALTLLDPGRTDALHCVAKAAAMLEYVAIDIEEGGSGPEVRRTAGLAVRMAEAACYTGQHKC